MKAIDEFTIADTRCRVVPAVGTDDEEGGELRARACCGTEAAQIIGKCSLNGRRYLILIDARASPPEPKDRVGILERLTQRELQVAMLVSKGLVNKQIADRLHLRECTVSSYMRRIFLKLGVRTRAAMVARVIAELGE
ncbi:response regulator transcription factor [Thiocapsa marina]|uniref:Transcriptional regulator, LuxR family n=1 Tax=Thiocapsa marina 5811 TaxID=768671 RepID=F9U5N7_9GAMM|nr:LuxR C-terminal-related transcriptional regulator [Thiocapsa marina]EGV20460.1 transcriptional regulator, LuxR family [Thiocapsa marina 5811]